MVERVDDSALRPPECKKSRTEEQRTEERNAAQEVREEMNRQNEAAALPEPRVVQEQPGHSRQTAQQPRRRRIRQTKERLNKPRLSERDLSRMQFKIRQSKMAQVEKVLEWMNYNENEGSSGGSMLLANTIQRRQAMERLLQLHEPDAFGAGPSGSRPRLTGCRFGQTGSRLRPHELNFTQSDSSITPTDSEHAPSDSMLAGSESETMHSDLDNVSELTLSDRNIRISVFDIRENHRLVLRHQHDLTPELTSDSSAQETFYSCESELLE